MVALRVFGVLAELPQSISQRLFLLFGELIEIERAKTHLLAGMREDDGSQLLLKRV